MRNASLSFQLRSKAMTMMALLLTSISIGAQDASTLVYKLDGKESAYPRLSNDNKKILYQSNASGHWQLYILDRTKGNHTLVLPGNSNDNFPDWSYDNEWIAFTSDRDGNEEIYIMRNDGSNLKRLTDHPERDIHPYFSPDGRYLLFSSTRGNGSFDIYRYTISSGDLKRLSDTPETETCARYSPDMQHMVYLQNDERKDDVIMADSLNKNPVNISNTPMIRDGWPVFSNDNNKIYYSSLESGVFCLYSILKNGTGKTQITSPQPGEEDARAFVSRDGKSIIYNKRYGTTIEIREIKLS